MKDGPIGRSVGVSIEGRAAARHLIERHTERKKIGTFVEWLSRNLFGRHIVQRAHSHMPGGQIFLSDRGIL